MTERSSGTSSLGFNVRSRWFLPGVCRQLGCSRHFQRQMEMECCVMRHCSAHARKREGFAIPSLNGAESLTPFHVHARFFIIPWRMPATFAMNESSPSACVCSRPETASPATIDRRRRSWRRRAELAVDLPGKSRVLMALILQDPWLGGGSKPSPFRREVGVMWIDSDRQWSRSWRGVGKRGSMMVSTAAEMPRSLRRQGSVPVEHSGKGFRRLVLGLKGVLSSGGGRMKHVAWSETAVCALRAVAEEPTWERQKGHGGQEGRADPMDRLDVLSWRRRGLTWPKVAPLLLLVAGRDRRQGHGTSPMSSPWKERAESSVVPDPEASIVLLEFCRGTVQ